eukprot:TRINITY_DN63550_c0_g1_i1.p1 TRINITY_DN63550_c0_g1~~TRINITY_DN63550_c0_g1_i1.p1  ORF type:complete len:175 (-),score=14.86 TRINITY_DN63550_c0_g1_i1:95-619(-)
MPLRDADGQPLPLWLQAPSRKAADIYATKGVRGTFHGRRRPSSITPPTVPDSGDGLERLLRGEPVVGREDVLVPSAHRSPSIPVRGATPRGPWAHLPPSPGPMPGSHYPRQGTPNSLAFRNVCERLGAHAGWGERVSLCASPGPSKFKFASKSKSSESAPAGEESPHSQDADDG